MLKKSCNLCNKEMEYSFFYYKGPPFDPLKKSAWSSFCKICIKKYKKEFYRKHKIRLSKKHKETYNLNKDKILLKNKIKRFQNASLEGKKRLENHRMVLELSKQDRYLYDRWYRWKRTAQKRKINFELSFKDILKLWSFHEGKCYYSNLKLELKPNLKETVSLDRIDSLQGYEFGNVVMCQTAVNLMKHKQDINSFIELCCKILLNRDNIERAKVCDGK